jgi:hypothetical protein
VYFRSFGFSPGPASQNHQQAQTRLAVVGGGSGADTETATVHVRVSARYRAVKRLNDFYRFCGVIEWGSLWWGYVHVMDESKLRRLTYFLRRKFSFRLNFSFSSPASVFVWLYADVRTSSSRCYTNDHVLAWHPRGIPRCAMDGLD